MMTNMGIIIVTDSILKKLPLLMQVLEEKVNIIDTLRRHERLETWIKCESDDFKPIKVGQEIPLYEIIYKNKDMKFQPCANLPKIKELQ